MKKQYKVIVKVIEHTELIKLQNELQTLKDDGFLQGNLCTSVIGEMLFYTVVCEKTILIE